MRKSYLYARRTGISGTAMLEISRREAIEIMKKNRGVDFQLGILGGADYSEVIRVYGEFAPYKKVLSVEELIDFVN
ncbi:hypothetical protein [Clostridium sp. DL1XJH146]